MPEKWLSDRRLLKLSDAAFRLHVTGLMWSVSNRTDGIIEADDLPVMPRVDPGAVAELEKADLWTQSRGRWLIKDFKGTQTSKKQLEQQDEAREADRVRKAAERAAAKAKKDAEEAAEAAAREAAQRGAESNVRPDVRRTSKRTSTGTSGRTSSGQAPDFIGQDRTGASSSTTTERSLPSEQESIGGGDVGVAVPDGDGWPAVAVPGAVLAEPPPTTPDLPGVAASSGEVDTGSEVLASSLALLERAYDR